MSFQLLAGIMEINERRPGGAEGSCNEHWDRFAVTPGGSDKTSLSDAPISHQRLQSEQRRREVEGEEERQGEGSSLIV